MSSDIRSHYDEPHTWEKTYVRLWESKFDGLIPVDSTKSRFRAWWWRRSGYTVVAICKLKE